MLAIVASSRSIIAAASAAENPIQVAFVMVLGLHGLLSKRNELFRMKFEAETAAAHRHFALNCLASGLTRDDTCTYLNGMIRSGILRPWPRASRTRGARGGRRAEAARNDERILEAARAVFIADPGAPISAVAAHAGVGVGALYRRYTSKEELLRRLSADGLQRFIDAAEAALADHGDPWEAFAGFMRRCVDSDTNSLTQRLAGTFTPTEELYREAGRAQGLLTALFERTRPPAPSARTSRSTTSGCCSSRSRRSASATPDARSSCATATSR